MAKTHRFQPAIDDMETQPLGGASSPAVDVPPAPPPEGKAVPDKGPTPSAEAELEITGYQTGEMEGFLLTASGAFQAASAAAEAGSSHAGGADQASTGLDLDWEALPARLRRGAPPRQSESKAPPKGPGGEAAGQARPAPGGPGTQGPALAPREAPAARAARGAAAAEEDKREFHAIDVRRPKLGILLVGVLLVGAGVGLIFWKRHAAEVASAEIRAAIDHFNEQRAGLYDQLGAAARADNPIDDSFCPRLGRIDEDTTFVFDGDPVYGFPTKTRGEREMDRYESFLDGDIHHDIFDQGNRDLAQVGPAVVWVHVRNWRRARVASAGALASGEYVGFAPAFLIGDAYVGDATTGRPVCSFRFFASSSQRVRRHTSPEADTSEDLLARTYEAIDAGARSVRAAPGVSGGRYEGTEPPTGF